MYADFFMDNNFLNEYRCNCGKLLFKGDLKKCRVEIKCKRCSQIKVFDFYAKEGNSELYRCGVDKDRLMRI